MKFTQYRCNHYGNHLYRGDLLRQRLVRQLDYVQAGNRRALGSRYLKYIMLSVPILGLLFVFTNAFQGMGKSIPAMILSVSRQGFVFIPIVFIADASYGCDGIVFRTANRRYRQCDYVHYHVYYHLEERLQIARNSIYGNTETRSKSGIKKNPAGYPAGFFMLY